MTPSERRWLIVASGLIVLLTSAPYLIGLVKSSPDHPFSGVILLRDDLYSYFAKMRVGAEGEWLYQNRYAVEPHRAAPLYLYYILLGKVAAFDAGKRIPIGQLIATYHISRALLGFALVILIYPVVGLLLTEPRQRRLAWVLIVLGGGLGWLMVLILREPLPFGSAPIDLYVGEAVTYVPLLILPHLLMARAALLAGVLCFVRAVATIDWRWALAAGMCWLVATIGVPFDILVAGSIVGGWIVARWAISRQFPSHMVWLALLGGLPGVLFDIVTLLVIQGDPVYAAWNAQNQLGLPHVLHLISAYGMQFTLVLAGARAVIKRRDPYADLFVGWLIASPLLWLVPVPFRLRLIEGFMIPLGVLSIAGLFYVIRAWSDWLRRAAIAGLLLLLLPSGLFIILGSIAQPLYGAAYDTRDHVAAMEWLRQNVVVDSIILSSEETGVMLPAFAPVRVVLGHGFETPSFAQKEREAQAFFAGSGTVAERRSVLERYNVRYIWFGSAERVLACESAECPEALADANSLGLIPVFTAGPFTIYEVMP